MDNIAQIHVNEAQRLHEMQQLQNAQISEVPGEPGSLMAPDADRVNLNAKFSTYSAFAKSYPKLHKATMMSLAQSVLTDMRRHEANMKRLVREARQNGG